MKTNNKKLIIIVTSIIVFILLSAIALLLVYHFKTTKQNQFDENNVGEIYYQQIDEKHIGKTDGGIQYADNEILIVTKDNVSKGKVEKLAKKYDAKIVGRIEQTGDYQLLLSKVHTLYELNQIAKDIENEKIVDSAYANYISEVSENSIDYDINTGNRWNVIIRASLFNDKEWGVEAINAPQAWVVMNVLKKQMNPVKVGLIDGCFDTKHEDLDFVKNFYDDNNNDINIDKENAEDFSAVSHGTHVAGTMAARGDNNEGICGVYPYGKDNLYGVSMLGVNYYNKKQSVVQLKCALSELIFRNVKIINYSMGLEDEYIYIYYGKDEKKKEDNRQNIENRANQLGSFLNRCLDKHYDFVIVTAAGNESNKTYEIDGVNNEKETVHTNRMESKYESEFNAIEFDDFPRVANRVITVGAVDKNYNVCDFSDLSMIYAPGEKIFSTAYGNKYQNTFKQGTKTYGWSGTSMAAPHVAGVAADVWTVNNKLDGEQVKQIIIESKLDESKESYPVVDAYKAVNKALATRGKGVSLKENHGAVLGWVVAEHDESITIKNASIIAYDENDKEMQNTTTDEYGHFELILPAGKYKIVVSASNYEEAAMTVNVVNSEVLYPDWIKLKAQKADSKKVISGKEPTKLTSENKVSLAEQYAKIVMDNEDIWLTPLELEYAYEKPTTTIINCWFEDLDSDSTPEFIVGPTYIAWGETCSYKFDIYKISDGNLVKTSDIKSVFEHDISYDSTTKKVPLTNEYGEITSESYYKKSKDERKNLLIDSFTSNSPKEQDNDNSESIYKPLLNYYKQGLNGNWNNIDNSISYLFNLSNNEDEFVMDYGTDAKKVSYLWNPPWGNPVSLNNAGYLIKDINNDGVKELIVAPLKNDYKDYTLIYDMYTVKNNKIVHLFAGGEKDLFSLDEKMNIFNFGFGGANYNGLTKMQIKKGTLVEDENWIQEGNNYYYCKGNCHIVTEGEYGKEYSYDYSKLDSISKAEFDRKFKNYESESIKLKLNKLIDYK